jgi:hypothetical protein
MEIWNQPLEIRITVAEARLLARVSLAQGARGGKSVIDSDRRGSAREDITGLGWVDVEPPDSYGLRLAS